MSAFPFILSIPDAEVYNLYTDRRFVPGQIAQTLDGRRFRFAINGAALLVPGDVLQGAAQIADHTLQTPTTAGKVGDATLVMTIGATAIWQNQYQDGVTSIELGTGFGFAYPNDRHLAYLASATTVAIPFKRGVLLQVAVPTTANSVTLFTAPHAGVIQFPATTATGVPVGIAVSAIPASGAAGATQQYGWVQVGGYAAVTCTGTSVIGTNAAVPSGTAGSFLAVALAITPVIGVVTHATTAAKKATVLLGGTLN